MEDIHWCKHYNNHPGLLNMDIQVKSHNIKDHNNGPWNPRNNIRAAHILYSTKDEKPMNKQMSGLYTKKQKASRVANDLPEGCLFKSMSLLNKQIQSPLPPVAKPNYKKSNNASNISLSVTILSRYGKL